MSSNSLLSPMTRIELQSNNLNGSVTNLVPQIECLAYLNQPKNFKMKKFNEKLNDVISSLIIGNGNNGPGTSVS